jgi:hypothetical protein
MACVGGIEGEIGNLVVTDAEGKLRLHVEGGPMPAVAFSTDGSRLVCSYSESEFLMGGGMEFRLRVLDGRTLRLVGLFRLRAWWFGILDARRA